MSDVISNMQKAFDKPLKQFGTDNSIIIALENIDAPTDTNTPYIAGFMLGGDINSADLSVNESLDGIYQIDVNYGSHTGSSKANTMIDKLRAKFPIGSYFYFGGDCFGVDSMTVTPLPVNNGWAQKSISLTLSAFTARL